MRKIFFLFVVLILNACEAIQVSGLVNNFLITDIIIRNRSNMDIKNVRLRVENSSGIFSCNYIISMTECSTSFPSRQYAGNKIEIIWVSGNKEISTGKIKLEIREELNQSKPVKGVVEIRSENQYNAFFVNEE